MSRRRRRRCWRRGRRRRRWRWWRRRRWRWWRRRRWRRPRKKCRRNKCKRINDDVGIKAIKIFPWKEIVSTINEVPLWSPLLHSLGFHLDCHTDFVSASIDVPAVHESRESHCNSIPEFLLVSQTNLTFVVYLGSESSSILQKVLSTNSESGRRGSRAPS